MQNVDFVNNIIALNVKRSLLPPMSHLSVALNEVLERMKSDTDITRQKFAERIGMPMSTLSSYTSERNRPDAAALGKLLAGVEEEDSKKLIAAHLSDHLPEEWRRRVAIDASAASGRAALVDFGDLPAAFRRDIELLLAEARHNKHLIGFVEEFVTLLGLRTDSVPSDILCPPDEKFPRQRVPTGPVHSRSGDSTPTLPGDSLSEEGAKPAPRTGPKTDAVGLRKKLRSMQKPGEKS